MNPQEQPPDGGSSGEAKKSPTGSVSEELTTEPEDNLSPDPENSTNLTEKASSMMIEDNADKPTVLNA